MLAYYVEWHMREAWRELMFADPDQAAKAVRDPVAPAVCFAGALDKVARRALDDDSPAHSFATLMAELAWVVRNTCRAPQTADTAPTFDILTTPNTEQQRALELLRQITVESERGTRNSSKSLEWQGKFDILARKLQINSVL